MPRPRKYTPEAVSQELFDEAQETFGKNSTVVQEFVVFLEKNRELFHDKERAQILRCWSLAQKKAGMMASSISARLAIVSKLTWTAQDPQKVLRSTLTGLKSALKTEKRKTPRESKAHLEIEDILDVIDPPMEKLRDQEYQTTIWTLAATGQRPSSLRNADFQLERDCIRVKYHGRKAEDQCRAGWLTYPFIWSCPPTPAIRNMLIKTGYPPIGTETNCASCINAWLKKTAGVDWTSCAPRRRMDNILHRLVNEKSLTENQFKDLMDHTLETSSMYYLE